MTYGPPPFPEAPPMRAPPVQRPDRRPVLVAALAGFVVALALVLGLAGAWPGGSGAGNDGSSSAAVSLPARVGTYERIADAVRKKAAGRTDATQAIARFRAIDRNTQAALSKAYGDAGAAVQTYTDAELLSNVRVYAVRAPTPDPVVDVVDAEDLGLAKPPREVITSGSSECVVTNQAAPAGQTPPERSTIVVSCQRSSGSLTVIVYPSGDAGTRGVASVAALVDGVWDGLR